MIPKSKLPSDVVGLNDSEGRVVYEALQGSWSIRPISMSEAMQKFQGGNEFVQPIAFDKATVTGLDYVMTGPGVPATQHFKFSKSPDTGQIYLDTWGSIVATQGWPYQRPMAGQVGEVIDFVTPFAALRWTRNAPEGARNGGTSFGEVQQQQPQAAGGGGGGAAEVAKLMQLRDQGVLSEDEFTAAKMKALGI